MREVRQLKLIEDNKEQIVYLKQKNKKLHEINETASVSTLNETIITPDVDTLYLN